MKKMIRVLRFLAVWLITLFALLICFAIILPTDEAGEVNLSGIHVLILLVVPIALGAFSLRKKKANTKETPKQKRPGFWSALTRKIKEAVKARRGKRRSKENFKVPLTKKGQTELAEDLLANIEVCVSLANKSECASLFIEWYDEALDGFSKLQQLEKVAFKGSPSFDYSRLKSELQWHLCDAIVRAKEKTISDIKGKYKNSREFQERALKVFEADINDIRSRFSADAAVLADESIEEIRGILDGKRSSSNRKTYTGLSSVDSMEGHDFEYWCADLLRKLDYTDVEVTKGSGDQGVDVLAVKEGVHYAIQCKCYSSDLGNKPIQEVHAGKSMYHCQVGVVMTNRFFTSGAKELAEATGVLLWDRDKLQQMVEESNHLNV